MLTEVQNKSVNTNIPLKQTQLRIVFVLIVILKMYL